MITGSVTAALEARISLHIEDGNGQVHPIEAVIDTGFSAFLSLPLAMVANLGLTWRDSQCVQLGNGAFVFFDVFSGVVIWDGQARPVNVYAIDGDPLVGMKMLAGYEVRIRVVDGGIVWIDAVP